MQLINTKLLSHPMNWLTILMMLSIAGIGGHFLLAYFGTAPAVGPINALPTDSDSGSMSSR